MNITSVGVDDDAEMYDEELKNWFALLILKWIVIRRERDRKFTKHSRIFEKGENWNASLVLMMS